MSKNITPQELKTWRKAEGLTQPELGDMIGLTKYAITTIETGSRNISEAEQRLLKLLIRGEAPFETQRGPWDPRIDFTAQEWALMTRCATREGYHSAPTWIVAKIRAYLAMSKTIPFYQEESANLEVAEDERSTFGNQKPTKQDEAEAQKPNGDENAS